MSTRRYLISKVLQALVTLAFVLVFNFFLFRVLPGDPLTAIRNPRLSAEAIRQLIHDFGLDKPMLQQFFIYVKETLTGNLGISFLFREPVAEVIASRFWNTMLLVGVSTILSTVFGLLIGIYGGWSRGSKLDVGTLGFSLVTYAMPEFWLGLLLLVAFAGGAGIFPAIFPTGGIVTPNGPTGLGAVFDVMNHMFLPTMTLTIAFLGEYALIMRSALLDVMGEDYVLTARAKGLRDKKVLWRHAVPNAMLPVMTLVVLNLGFVVSGAITIETVFSWPGLGLLTFQALPVKDFPLLQGLFLLFSAGVIIANLVADLLYSYLDPRVRAA